MKHTTHRAYLMRSISMALLGLAFCVSLAACGDTADAKLGQHASEYFGTTDVEIRNFAAMSQTLDKTANGGELSLRVQETLGDGKTLYVYGTVDLPEQWRGMPFAADGDAFSIVPDVVLFSYDDEEELKNPPSRTVIGSLMTNFRYLPDENACECIVRVYDRYGELTGRKLCLALRGVKVLSGGSNGETLAESEELLSVTWTAENTAQWRTSEEGSTLDCRLSPLCLDLSGTVDGASAGEGKDLRETVQLLDADGAVLSNDSFYMELNGGASLAPDGSTGRVDLTAFPPKGFVGDFSRIAAVSVGGVTYPIL